MGVELTDIETLDAAECLRLLASRTLGRIGLTIASLPAILPVCYELVDDVLVLRLERGSALAAATRNEIVAFEVDDLDQRTGTGWSVLVRGLARELHETVPSAWDGACRVRWHDPKQTRLVGVSTDVISGRRVQGTGSGPRTTQDPS